jgi:Uncharacterized protein conserved in bacteria
LKNKYLPYLDLLRIFAAPAIIALHCVSGFYNNPLLINSRSHILFAVINEFARAGVPIFFMISGYLALGGKTVPVGVYYRKRLPRLAVPLLCWNVIYYVFFALIGKITPSIPDLFSLAFNNGSAYHLWYLYVSFGLALLAPFIKKITDHTDIGELIILLVFILFPVALRPIINQFTPVYIFFFEPLVGGYAGYFLLGYMLGNYKFGKKFTYIIYFGGIAGFTAGLLGNLTGSAQFWNGGYTLNHFLFAGALFLFAKRHFHAEKIVAIRYCSDLSFGVYLSHVLFCELFAFIVSAARFTPAVYAAAQFLFALIASVFVTVLYKMIKKRFCHLEQKRLPSINM